MAWAVPKHTRSQVNAAGTALISPPSSPDAVRRALVVVNNWRASHSVPLNAIRANLRNHVVSESGEEALIAQRLKRLSSIEAKLRRSRHMQLARMQDVGGCRAVLPSTGSVRNVVRSFERSRTNHETKAQLLSAGTNTRKTSKKKRSAPTKKWRAQSATSRAERRCSCRSAPSTPCGARIRTTSPTRACSWPPSGRRPADCLTAKQGKWVASVWTYKETSLACVPCDALHTAEVAEEDLHRLSFLVLCRSGYPLPRHRAKAMARVMVRAVG